MLRIRHVFLTTWIILFSLTLQITCKFYQVDTYPDPRHDLIKCGRWNRETTAICDPDTTIDYSTSNKVDDILSEILTSTNSPCDDENGFKVVVTLMNYIGDTSECESSDNDCKAEKMARGLHDRFGVGKEGCDDGVLFLLSFKDR